MTDHATTIEFWARGDQGQRGRELREAAAELRRLKKLVDDCTDYLKDGETPRMALDRWARIMADDWYKPK